ncbi:ferrous iron transport protein B [Rhodococcus sp. D2-41]|uniref:ferrous iron transport protein B n=1 Tax=Speluncibacter jeojiensis TaxID=2710754 RepID=UPI002410B660|nr:ferrous iron transport protein B [Rhodococcus sp. D2-41]MDG3011037.1 ferrous iron transport protein B [Rhodococcus sp. D2-41]
MTAVEPAPAVKPSCHAGADGPAAEAGAPVVALVGAPNSGKSTLFNALTGGRRTVGNWPGTTVEVGRAGWKAAGNAVELLDLPGAYSLDAQSPDEQLTRDLLLEGPVEDRPEVTVVVADASHLTRSLYLVAQLREAAQRVVVVLTMLDVAKRRGITVDAEVLAKRLGVPVVALDPRRRGGSGEIGSVVAAELASCCLPRPRKIKISAEEADDDLAVADERFAWIDAAVERAATIETDVRATVTDRVDRWVTAPIVGPLIFLAVMWLVFELTTTVAAPIQDGLGSLFSGPVTDGANWVFDHIGLADSWVQLFVVNGLIAGVGMLLTFVPLMIIMFVLLALLEDSGYMARAAVVTDRAMRAIGLPGKAFLPLVVGFGCNVPAISATRILPGARQRIMTVLLVPFTSCSARLTVYVMIAATFFPAHAGTVVFGMYVTSIVIVILVGLAMKSTLWRTFGDESLMLDLPAYQRPTLRLTASVTWMRVRGFLRTAGGIIVVTVTVVWLLQAIPISGGASFGHVDPDDSLFAGVARVITPVFAPLGFGDWHTVGALIVGFVAKEAVISSWAQTYAAGDPTAGQSPAQLHDHISAAFAISSGGAVTAAVLAFLVFLLAYTPCVATVAAQIREIGRKWTAFGVVMQLTVAWTLALAVFQIGRLL